VNILKKLLVVLMGLAILASASQAVMIFGVDNSPAAVSGGLPYMGFKLNDDMRIDAGIQYVDLTQTLGLYGRFTSKISQVNKVKTYWGGALGIKAASGTTTILISGLIGAEYKIDDNFGVYADVNVLSLESNSGSTNFELLTGSSSVYSGLRVYL
jgi:predicted porin